MEVIVHTVGCLMVNFDKKEIKIISLGFRQLANRLINCHPDTGIPLLKMFISYIENIPIIIEFIKDNLTPDEFIPPKRGTHYISMGETKQEEISETYKLLKYASENYTNYYSELCFYYSREPKDSVKEFNNRFILPFVNYIEGYFTEILIRIGDDEIQKYNITINGGTPQVNIASSSSVISNPTLISSNDIGKINEIINILIRNKPHFDNEDDKKAFDESIEVIQLETKNQIPKKSMVSTAVKTLQALKGSVEFTAAVASIYEVLKGIL